MALPSAPTSAGCEGQENKRVTAGSSSGPWSRVLPFASLWRGGGRGCLSFPAENWGGGQRDTYSLQPPRLLCSIFFWGGGFKGYLSGA